MFVRTLWLTASLPILAAARNCTARPILSDDAVGWQPGECYRGTWNIISTCLSTIVACTWSIQHLNIPATDDGAWKKSKRKIKWMIITVLFPELVMIHAMLEFHMAWKALRLMSKNRKPVEWPWWFRNPPLSWLPYCRRYLNGEDLEGQNSEGHINEIKWTLVHCYFANMGGFVHYRGKNSFPVTAQQLAESPLFDSPAVSVEDIEDKSKQDWLAKIFAALQILQLILSIITRHIQGLQFSQLETVTLSFAICGLVIYYTYFHKPQNIGRPVELQNYMLLSDNASQNGATGAQATLADEEIQRKSASLQKTTPQLSLQFQQTYDSFWAIILNQHSRPGKTGGPSYPKRIPNDNIPIYEGSNDVHPAVYLLALASGLFGAIHAIAWYFEFPTDVEKLLWQIATGISAASPVVGLLAIPLAQLTKSAGTHELFMGNCLRLMQEYYWQFRNNTSVRHAINELEYAFATGQRKSYAAIFPAAETGDNKLLLDLRDFLHLQGDSNGLDTKPFELHDDKLFIRNFHRLVSALNGTETKKIQEAAWTDTWPRKSVFPREINQALLYITGILYCASRLLLLGISLSSVRKMPGSVYIQANWTQYLPAFGASSG